MPDRADGYPLEPTGTASNYLIIPDGTIKNNQNHGPTFTGVWSLSSPNRFVIQYTEKEMLDMSVDEERYITDRIDRREEYTVSNPEVGILCFENGGSKHCACTRKTP